MAYPDYWREKLPNNLSLVHDCGYTYHIDRYGNVYDTCPQCGELFPELQLDNEDGTCAKCWDAYHRCWQCGEFDDKLHTAEDGHRYCAECYVEFLEEVINKIRRLVK
jgi:hypothetical protein